MLAALWGPRCLFLIHDFVFFPLYLCPFPKFPPLIISGPFFPLFFRFFFRWRCYMLFVREVSQALVVVTVLNPVVASPNKAFGGVIDCHMYKYIYIFCQLVVLYILEHGIVYIQYIYYVLGTLYLFWKYF